MESMRQADSKNWSLQPGQFADLAESLNNFFQQTGVAGFLNTSRGSGGGMHPSIDLYNMQQEISGCDEKVVVELGNRRGKSNQR